MDGFWILLAFSVPVFYIWGLVNFIKWVTHHNKPQLSRKQFLEQAISELESIIGKSPNKSLIKVLEDYKQELASIPAENQIILPAETAGKRSELKVGSVVEDKIILPAEAPATPKVSIQEDLNQAWGNWYSDNSINLLLYIGAFLIVASASIFVGFRWESLGGVSKGTVLTLMNLAFFGFGFWFYNISKIKNAGATFIAIGALLIPFTGLAWHNFVFGPAGYPIGATWLATSIIAIFSYAFLAFYIRHPFYTYIAGFGGLSMILSTVNVVDLNQEFYILGAIFSSFVLLLSTRMFSGLTQEDQKIYATPLLISAHVIMPLSLFWGLTLAASTERLDSFEVVTSGFLATAYYFLAYTFARNTSYLTVSAFLLALSIFLGGRYLELDTQYIFLGVQLLSAGYLGIAFFAKEYKKEAESFQLSANVLLPFSALGIFVLSVNSTSPFSLMLTSSFAIATLFYYFSYLIKRESSYLLASLFLLAATTFTFGKWLDLADLLVFNILQGLSLIYLAFTYMFEKTFPAESNRLKLSAHIVLPFASLLLFGYSEPDFYNFNLLIGSFAASAFYLGAYFIKRANYFSAIGLILLVISTFVFARWLDISLLYSLYIVEILLFGYLLFAYAMKPIDNKFSKVMVLVSLSVAAYLWIVVVGNEFSDFHGTLFAAIPAVFGLIAVYVRGNDNYLYYNIIFLTLSVLLYFGRLLGFDDQPHIIGLAYLAITIVFYVLSVLVTQRRVASRAFLHAALLNIALGSFFTINEARFFLIANLVTASLLLDYSIRYLNYQLIYLSNFFLYLGTWSFLRTIQTELTYYPLIFGALAYIFYGISLTIGEKFRQFYRVTALVGTGLNTLMFGITGLSSPDTRFDAQTRTYVNLGNDLERNALISAYASTFLYSLDAAITRISSFAYFASAVGMATYLWQINYLGVNETLIYTIPLGIYFLVLGYFQRLAGKLDNQKALEYVGLFFLLVPTFLLSFGENAFWYSLVLGLEGVILIFLGVSLSNKTHTYIGTAALVIAVISQTYEFFFSLPRWLITAVVGLLFLGTAIYLLLRRKEPGEEIKGSRQA